MVCEICKSREACYLVSLKTSVGGVMKIRACEVCKNDKAITLQDKNIEHKVSLFTGDPSLKKKSWL